MTIHMKRKLVFAFGFFLMIFAGYLFGGCGDSIPTLPTLVFNADGGADGG